MKENLKCFISSSHEIDTSIVKSILADNNVDVFDIYDFSIGESIQQILKRKIKESDFAIFILAKNSQNVLYEMGVCEGLGKQHFIFFHKDYIPPFYVDNQLFLRGTLDDRKAIQFTIENILTEVKKHKKPKTIKSKIDERIYYSEEVKYNLRSYLSQISNLREEGTGLELEYIVGQIFKIINLNYAENSSHLDKGVDFALWNNKLGKIIGNPIIVELKYGKFTNESFKKAEYQIRDYAQKSDAKLALLLYLDKENKRYTIDRFMNPLIISYDIEDLVNDLIEDSFENIILSHRNKIAHGQD